MGLFQSIKNKLGIGGGTVTLQSPNQISKDQLTATGKIILTTKSDQHIVDIKVKVLEEFTKGKGDDKETKEFTLGSTVIPSDFMLKAGETKELDFSFDFELLKSSNDELKEKGGAMGALGSLAQFANGEKSVYYIVADVDVKSAVLDPSDKKEFRLA